MESFSQFRSQNKGNCFHIHLNYIPFLGCSGEYKTKPIQSSIRELLKAGLQPDLIVSRFEPNWSDHQDFIDNLYPILDTKLTSKISLFANLSPAQVISLPDLKSIYEVPLYLQKTGLIAILNRFLNYKPELQAWNNWNNESQDKLNHTKSDSKFDAKNNSKHTQNDQTQIASQQKKFM